MSSSRNDELRNIVVLSARGEIFVTREAGWMLTTMYAQVLFHAAEVAMQTQLRSHTLSHTDHD